jgi:hypothetical protein
VEWRGLQHTHIYIYIYELMTHVILLLSHIYIYLFIYIYIYIYSCKYVLWIWGKPCPWHRARTLGAHGQVLAVFVRFSRVKNGSLQGPWEPLVGLVAALKHQHMYLQQMFKYWCTSNISTNTMFNNCCPAASINIFAPAHLQQGTSGTCLVSVGCSATSYFGKRPGPRRGRLYSQVRTVNYSKGFRMLRSRYDLFNH